MSNSEQIRLELVKAIVAAEAGGQLTQYARAPESDADRAARIGAKVDALEAIVTKGAVRLGGDYARPGSPKGTRVVEAALPG